MKRPTLVDLMMAEHIEMPGFPQIIVTRGFAYQWLKACGWDVSERGYGSLDYIVFVKSVMAQPLTEDIERDYWLAKARNDYLRGIAA